MTDAAQAFDKALESPKNARTDTASDWWTAGVAMLSVRFIQGFIYWGGGSRRFIYAPAKLDPHATSWMANKFQTAMPGALFGLDHLMSYMLTHFALLYAGVIVFSAVELVFGAMLMVGLLTRLAALVSMGLSVLLMAMFGWQGATCIDEWTMAACNLAMGATLFLGGGGAYSLDGRLLRSRAALAGQAWFRWFGGALPLPLSLGAYRRLGLAVFAFVAIYNVGTYNYYRGSVISPFHGGPVSPTKHHLTLTKAVVLPGGGVRFHVYLDAGTPEAPVHVMQAALLDAGKKPIVQWDAKALAKTPKSAFANDYPYNKFSPGPFGLRAPVGAAATITLTPPAAAATAGAASASAAPPTPGPAPQAAYLKLTDVDGQAFVAPIGG